MVNFYKKNFDYTFLIPSGLFMLIFMIYPILFNIVLSFKEVNVSNLIEGNQSFAGFDNYIAVFSNDLFSKALLNTILFTVGTLVFSTFIGFVLALFFNQRFPGHRWMRAILLVAWMTPVIIGGTIFKWMLSSDYGIINHLLINIGVISEPIGWLTNPHTALFSIIVTNIWISIPFSMTILLSGLQGLPLDVYEAAKIDGASRLQKLFYITVPLMKPTVLVLLMLGVIYTFKVFDIIYIMTGGGPADATQVTPFFAYQLSFQTFHFGEGAALSNIAFVIIFIVALIYLRIIRKESVVD